MPLTRVPDKPMSKTATAAANSHVPVVANAVQKKAWIDAYEHAGGKLKIVKAKTNGATPSDQLAQSAQNKKKLKSAQIAAKQQPAGSPDSCVQACPLQGCQINTLTITGTHNPNRAYKLELSATKPSKQELLQVLGGITDQTAATIKIQFAGSCVKQTPGCPSISVRGGKINETFTSATSEIKLMSADPSTAAKFANNLVPFSFFSENLLFPSNAPKQTYSIKTNGCSGHQPLSATVEAITQVGWNGAVTWGWEKVPWKNDQFKLKKHDRKFKFGVEVSGNYDTHTFKVDAVWEKKSKPGNIIEKILGMADTMLEKMSIFDEMNHEANKALRQRNKKRQDPTSLAKGMAPEIKVNIQWPKFAISGEASNVEIKGDYRVATKGNVKIEAKPFIGADISTDILDWIAAAWPPILKFKKIAAEGYDSKTFGAKGILAVIFGIEGNVKGKIDTTFNQQHWDVSGVIEGALSFILKAEVYAEGRAWRLFVRTGASVSAQSAENPSDTPGLRIKVMAEKGDKEAKLVGHARFTGITIYGAYYVHYGIKDVETTEGKTKSTRGDTKVEAKERAKLEEKKLEEVWQMCKPVILLGNE